MDNNIKQLKQVELALEKFCSKNGHLMSSFDKKSLRSIRSKIKSIRKQIGKNNKPNAKVSLLDLIRLLNVFFGVGDLFDSFFDI